MRVSTGESGARYLFPIKHNPLKAVPDSPEVKNRQDFFKPGDREGDRVRSTEWCGWEEKVPPGHFWVKICCIHKNFVNTGYSLAFFLPHESVCRTLMSGMPVWIKPPERDAAERSGRGSRTNICRLVPVIVGFQFGRSIPLLTI